MESYELSDNQLEDFGLDMGGYYRFLTGDLQELAQEVRKKLLEDIQAHSLPKRFRGGDYWQGLLKAHEVED